LATGLDPVFGVFPENVYVFDFFQKLTGSNGMMLSQYATGPGDSHPNAAATALVAPQLVQELFNASIEYESAFGVVPLSGNPGSRISAFPNPFGDKTQISFTLSMDQPAELTLFDITGKKLRTLWMGNKKGGYHLFLQGNQIPAGIFTVNLSAGDTGHLLKVIHK
jgi:hypothetical protein